MKKFYIVAGLQFGDEGKGLATDYFCNQFPDNSVLGVLTNGSGQRSHTVIANGKRHAFRHHSSGTFASAATYISDYFIIHPILFREEHEKFKDALVYADINSRILLPGDTILCQAKENHRTHKDGSCGFGIYETDLRSKFWTPFTLMNVLDMTQDEFVVYNKVLADKWYIPCMEKNLRFTGDYSTPTKFTAEEIEKAKSLLYEDNIYRAYYDDIKYFIDNVEIVTNKKQIYDDFDIVVMENGQGLMLSEKYASPFNPFVTGSDTGSKRVISELTNLGYSEKEIEVCYVMRRYRTRHGAGPMDMSFANGATSVGEGPDKTNEPNPWQTSIRYASHNFLDIKRMIEDDFTSKKVRYTIMVTHLTDKLEISLEGKDAKLMDFWENLLRKNLEVDQLYIATGEDYIVNKNVINAYERLF
jgi:adenylosuccinate synthase